MRIEGSSLSFPVRADNRGTVSIVNDRHAIIEQSIASIIETRQGERVMLPDYGLPDFVFSVINAGAVARLAYLVEQQIAQYEPLVDRVKVSVQNASNAQQMEIRVSYMERGSNTPRNLVFPIWELRQQVRR